MALGFSHISLCCAACDPLPRCRAASDTSKYNSKSITCSDCWSCSTNLAWITILIRSCYRRGVHVGRRTLHARQAQAYLPYYILAVLAIGLWWAMSAQNPPNIALEVDFRPPFYRRALKALLLVFGDGKPDWSRGIPALIAFAAPLLLGRRAGSAQAWTPFAVCVVVILFAPVFGCLRDIFTSDFTYFSFPSGPWRSGPTQRTQCPPDGPNAFCRTSDRGVRGHSIPSTTSVCV